MVELKTTIIIIVILVFLLGSSLGLFNIIMPAVASHFGSIAVFSDVFTGGGNSSYPINEFTFGKPFGIVPPAQISPELR